MTQPSPIHVLSRISLICGAFSLLGYLNPRFVFHPSGWFVFPAIIAIGLGIVCLLFVRSLPGKAVAIAGIACGLASFTGLLKLPSRPSYVEGREASDLRQVALALLIYKNKYGCFPPEVIRDKAGKPLYSWRVLMLPYLDETDLYKDFHLDEPWDSPHNIRLTAVTPKAFRSYRYEIAPGTTLFQAFVGPRTVFNRQDDFPDAPERTLLIAVGSQPVPWAKPGDLVFDPEGPLPSLGGPLPRTRNSISSWTTETYNAAFVDGHVERFSKRQSQEKQVREMIIRNDGLPLREIQP